MAPRIRDINENKFKTENENENIVGNENGNLIMDLTVELRRFVETYENVSDLQNDYSGASSSENEVEEEEDGFFQIDADVMDRALRNASKYESDNDADVNASEHNYDGDADVSDSEHESDEKYDTEDDYSKIDPYVHDELVRNFREY